MTLDAHDSQPPGNAAGHDSEAMADLVDVWGDLRAAAWMEDALCAQTDPAIFFPEKGGSTRAAVNVCRSCPVAAECLEHALNTEQRFGIWGGTTERKRRKIGQLDAAHEQERSA